MCKRFVAWRRHLFFLPPFAVVCDSPPNREQDRNSGMLFTLKLKLKLEIHLVEVFSGVAMPQYDDSFRQLIATNVAAGVPTSKIVAELRIAARTVQRYR